MSASMPRVPLSSRIGVWMALWAVLVLGGCAGVSGPAPSPGHVERLEILGRQAAFGGQAFGAAGEYELVDAVAHMVADVRHPANQGIVDLAAAANGQSEVRYDTKLVILRPRNAALASKVMLVEAPNRGGKLSLLLLNDGNTGVMTAGDAGNGWAMRQGHTMVWVGWQGDVPMTTGPQHAVGMRLPVATRGGQAITGTSLEEAVFDAPGATGRMRLSYAAATLDPGQAQLTVRARPESLATVVAASAWRYLSAHEIELQRDARFDAGAIYQFTYAAKDPRPMGLGMAAMRDVVSHLKRPDATLQGVANPVGDIAPQVSVAVGVSQSGRFLRDFIWQGFNADFNADASGRPVFDGVMPTIAGSRKSFTNARWAQPGRYSRQHEDHTVFGDQFPFGYATLRDPLTGQTDGIFQRCSANRTCPKLMHLDSSLEFWQARAGLVATDGVGNDVAQPDNVRLYLMSSTQHVASAKPVAGMCTLPNNTALQAAFYRALLSHLITWARDGQTPPDSRYPSVAHGDLVLPQQAAMGFPNLDGLGLMLPRTPNELAVVNHQAVPGQPDSTRRYLVLVPRTDADGHDLAGLRGPDITTPLATHTGFNLRQPGHAPGQLCGLNGSQLAFSADEAQRAAQGDPRPSIAARYPNRAAYLSAYRAAAEALHAQGLVLQEDVTRLMEAAQANPLVQTMTP